MIDTIVKPHSEVDNADNGELYDYIIQVRIPVKNKLTGEISFISQEQFFEDKGLLYNPLNQS